MSATKSRLRAIEPKAAQPAKPKMLIYGKPNAGKTWAALDFPSTYYIDTEGGANLEHYTAKLERSRGIYMGPDEGALSFATIIEQVQALNTEHHNFRTLVIDSISKLFAVAVNDEAERLERANVKNEFGADRRPAVAWMRRLVGHINRLDMNVLLIAHEKTEWGLINGQRAEVGSTFDCWDKLEYELHLALHIAKQGTSRVARVRKTRLQQFPEASSFPWSYDDFADRYGRDVMEAEAVPVVLATADQLAELDRLLGVVKLPDGQVEKWLSAAGVESWSEMEAERVSKAIEFMKGKLA